MSFFERVKNIFIGNRLSDKNQGEQKFSIFSGLPILASDAISSVAYAGQEILVFLLYTASIGISISLHSLIWLSLSIVGLLGFLTLSYFQIIKAYPNGGGAYLVCQKNFGETLSLIAASALIIDYILTVSVSIASGVQQLTSVWPALQPYTTQFAVLVICLIALINLRGLKESARILGVLPYVFIGLMIFMICYGLFNFYFGHPIIGATNSHTALEHLKSLGTGVLTPFILLQAFSNGCAAVTGVEAVASVTPEFKEDRVFNARAVLILLASILLILFLGTSVVASLYKIYPGEDEALLIKIASTLFGNNLIFYLIMSTTFIILFLAANTAYHGFPSILYSVSSQEYLPRWFTKKGTRLSYSNSIIALTIISSLIIIFTEGSVTRLVPLYAIGVFVTFTLSQAAIVKYAFKNRPSSFWSIVIFSGMGTIVTFVVLIVQIISKFSFGGWLIIIIIPALSIFMKIIKEHYKSSNLRLKRLFKATLSEKVIKKELCIKFVVLIKEWDGVALKQIQYARSITRDYVILNVTNSEKHSKEFIAKGIKYGITKGKLISINTEYRNPLDLITKYVFDRTNSLNKDEIINVVLPRISVVGLKQSLHSRTTSILESRFAKNKKVNVTLVSVSFVEEK